MAPEVDPHHPVSEYQPAGQRVVHAGTEPVGMEENDRWAVPTPVQPRGADPVAFDAPGQRVAGAEIPGDPIPADGAHQRVLRSHRPVMDRSLAGPPSDRRDEDGEP